MISSVDLVVGYKGQDGTILYNQYKSQSRDFIAISRNLVQININNVSDTYPISFLSQLIGQYTVSRIFFFSAISQSTEDLKDFDFLDHYESGIGLLVRILNILKDSQPRIKPCILYASSALVLKERVLANTDCFQPQNRNYSSKYCVIKAIGEHICSQLISDGYEAYVVIFFNHESCYRKPGFLFFKIITYALNLKLNIPQEPISLISPNISLDVGYGPEYMQLCTKLIDSGTPGTYILSTEKLFTINQFLSFTSTTIGFDLPNISFLSDKYCSDRIVTSSNKHLYSAIDAKPSIFGLCLIQNLIYDYSEYLGINYL